MSSLDSFFHFNEQQGLYSSVVLSVLRKPQLFDQLRQFLHTFNHRVIQCAMSSVDAYGSLRQCSKSPSTISTLFLIKRECSGRLSPNGCGAPHPQLVQYLHTMKRLSLDTVALPHLLGTLMVRHTHNKFFIHQDLSQRQRREQSLICWLYVFRHQALVIFFSIPQYFAQSSMQLVNSNSSFVDLGLRQILHSKSLVPSVPVPAHSKIRLPSLSDECLEVV